MKRTLLIMCGVVVLMLQQQVSAQTQRPPKCGMEGYHNAMIARDSSWVQKFKDQKASLQAAADFYKQYKAQQDALSVDQRTSSTISPVPIVFHIVVDSAQFTALGGTAGIVARCNSQIAVLNADYNHENSDASMIPSAWADSLYGNPGIHFGLAQVDPNGNYTPGFEVKIISGSTTSDAGFDVFYEVDNGLVPAEKVASTGLAAWDNTRYYNVWCVNFTGSSSNGLGITQPKSDLTSSTMYQEGVAILYNVLGSTGPSGIAPAGTGSWYNPYNLGRTLTHETGHFFEIWHPWGDDGPGNYYQGYCPWAGITPCSTSDNSMGSDDGLFDTPPESQAVYGNPTYTITGGTINDCCQMYLGANTQPIGIACLSFMDYTDDDAMHLFTPQQAAAMASMVLVPPGSATGATGYGTIGENYSLTQNPGLASTGVTASPIEINASLSIYPNPTTGVLNISLNSTTEKLDNIIVVNLLGQQVATISGQGKDYYTIDLAGMSKGIYFVKCNFASGSVTRKILLQ